MADALRLWVHRLATPTGEMLLFADGEGRLRAAEWTDNRARLDRLLARYCGPAGFTLEPARASGSLPAAMTGYFAGDVTAIDALPVEPGGTEFQRQVWRCLRAIPAGETITYRQLAVHAGRPDAIRAAGAANGANPVSIVIPCHRVIGSNGALTGYGGGLARKGWLLAHEGKHKNAG